MSGLREPKGVLHLDCPLSLTLSFQTGNVYAVDSCSKTITTSKIDGSNQEIIVSNIGSGFAFGSSVFENKLFWSLTAEISTVMYYDLNMSTSHKLFLKSSDIFNDLMVVHSSNQLSGKF